MKISGIELFHVEPRWTLLRVDTEEGISGWGEPIVEGFSRSTAEVVKDLSDVLIGRDPRRIEDAWQTLYRGSFYRGGTHLMSAISGIDQALWDITGKYFNAPVHELLGGRVRDHIRMYAHCKDGENPGRDVQAMKIVERGFDAMKVLTGAPIADYPSPAVLYREAERINSIRTAVGWDVDIAVDFHGRLSGDAAIQLINLLSDMKPMFVEEPVLPEDPREMLRVRSSTRVPIATGERLLTRWGFRELVELRAASILQPDLCHAGGISETRRIASMAETAFMGIAPHNPLGPISLASCLQLAAAIPNFVIQEHPSLPDGSDLGFGILKTPFEIVNGKIDVPQGPGLGVEVDEDALRSRTNEGGWRTPQLRHADGSVADW